MNPLVAVLITTSESICKGNKQMRYFFELCKTVDGASTRLDTFTNPAEVKPAHFADGHYLLVSDMYRKCGTVKLSTLEDFEGWSAGAERAAAWNPPSTRTVAEGAERLQKAMQAALPVDGSMSLSAASQAAFGGLKKGLLNATLAARERACGGITGKGAFSARLRNECPGESPVKAEAPRDPESTQSVMATLARLVAQPEPRAMGTPYMNPDVLAQAAEHSADALAASLLAARYKQPAGLTELGPETSLDKFCNDMHINLPKEGEPLADANPKTAVAAGKPRVSDVPPVGLFAMGAAMHDGAKKYGRFNWRDSNVTASVFYDAIHRHLTAWYSGQDHAPDSLIHHLGHIMADCAIILDAEIQGVLNDDRDKRFPSEVLHSWWMAAAPRNVLQAEAAANVKKSTPQE